MAALELSGNLHDDEPVEDRDISMIAEVIYTEGVDVIARLGTLEAAREPYSSLSSYWQERFQGRFE